MELKDSKAFLDSRELCGKTFLRNIAAATWSSKYGLGGRAIADLRLTEILCKGFRNHHLRALSHRRFMSLVVARKINEAVFASALLTGIRENKWDMDELAQNFFQTHPELRPERGRGSVEEYKAQLLSVMAKGAISAPEAFVPQPDEKDKGIMELEQQIEASNKMPPAEPKPPIHNRQQNGDEWRGSSRIPFYGRLRSLQAMRIILFKPIQALDPRKVPQVRVLVQTQPINGVTKTMVDTWVKGLNKNDKVEYDQMVASLTLGSEKVKELSSQTVSQLKDKLAQLGLPIQMAAKVKAPEMIQLLIAETHLPEVCEGQVPDKQLD